MVHFRIIALGRPKEEWIRQALAHYTKLISKFADTEYVYIKPAKIKDESYKQIILQKECEAILSRLNPGSYCIALDECGKILSSQDFSIELERQFQAGKSTIDFIIGSPLGLADEVRKKADLILSFSKMTFPHELALVMLTEQLYRAMSILHGGKYHK